MRTAAVGIAGGTGGQWVKVNPLDAGTRHRRPRPGLASTRLAYLSHVNDPGSTSLYPGDPEFTLRTATRIGVEGFYTQLVCEGEHTGTHWGSPGHFREGGLLADQLDPHDLFLPAVCVDIRDKASKDEDYELTVGDLRAFERRHGRIPDEAAIVLRTGWEDRWGTEAYANLDGDGVIHQPGFGPDATEWLLGRGCLGRRGALGTDTFSPDRGVDSAFTVSNLLYDRHRISLENLANLAALPPAGAHVLVGGPRHRNGSGSTATIFALLPA